MTHVPVDYDDFFSRLGEDYVMRSMLNGSFTGKTLKAAESWLAYSSRRKSNKDRVRTLVLTGGSLIVGVTGVILKLTVGS